ncbi:ankyrin repeat domain-containing protein [Jeongeupia chitinilytica]|uniref:ankyrin repeat domain-containing protein n=1 Tax=Jeongeupia chitinilytica TaxID=1041641 RepID=UPI00167AA601|nr:ankyrin repeat domain-containing protein [Jeongeupia chitinilytica]
MHTLLEQHGQAHRAPTRLIEQFPRIANRLVELWGTDAMSGYLESLMIMDRPDRQGFPPEIGMELMSFGNAHDDILHRPAAEAGVWDHVREAAIDQLDRLGLRATVGDFHRHVGQGKPETLQLYLDAGLKVDSADDNGWTALMRASFDGSISSAEWLLTHGADIHATDRGGYTPLHWAALNGYDTVVDLLVNRGANVNAESQSGFTALIQAASRGHLVIVKRLIAAGARVGTSTPDGWTALHKAVANRHTDVAIRLLDHGADPDARHQDGSTPYTIAAQTGQQRLCELMLLTQSVRQRERH